MPTEKPIKVAITKTPTKAKATTKKVGSVLGIETTPTANPKITPALGTKLKQDIPWEEIKFWLLGLIILAIISGIIMVDRKRN